MLLIAIETSTKYGGVALYRDGKPLGIRTFTPQLPASDVLIPSMAALLESNDLKLQDIQQFAVATGPGSFTGLRVGMTAAKTMAYFNNKSVIGIPTLDVLAQPYEDVGRPIIALLYAGKGQVYGAEFQCSPRFTPAEYRVDSVEAFLENSDKEIIVVGDAIVNYREQILQAAGKGCKLAEEKFWRPGPQAVAELAQRACYPRYEGQALFAMSPRYLRRSEAEVQWDRKHASK